MASISRRRDRGRLAATAALPQHNPFDYAQGLYELNQVAGDPMWAGIAAAFLNSQLV